MDDKQWFRQILQWKLADVRKKASNTINRLGYITACEIFVAACKELKADVRALEKLLESRLKDNFTFKFNYFKFILTYKNI